MQPVALRQIAVLQRLVRRDAATIQSRQGLAQSRLSLVGATLELQEPSSVSFEISGFLGDPGERSRGVARAVYSRIFRMDLRDFCPLRIILRMRLKKSKTKPTGSRTRDLMIPNTIFTIARDIAIGSP